MVSPCFQFERGQNFPFDWPASVSNILTVRKWAEPKIVGRNFTSRIRPLVVRTKVINREYVQMIVDAQTIEHVDKFV